MSSEEMSQGKVVCVTGASGYIASWLVKLLLRYGYTVRATVRDPNDPEKVEHLKRLEGANERLHLFKADLLDEGSFDSAICGCHGVFHTASPVNFDVKDPQVEVFDPAVKGTLNVLRACKQISSVRRVVLTSLHVQVLFTGKPVTPNVVVDKTWFLKPEFCGQFPNMKWYIISKVMAEEAAWNFAKEYGLVLVSMNPGMVIGPVLPPNINDTIAIFFSLLNNEIETCPNVAIPWVHVQDVAESHIRAFELPSANGRCADDEPLAQTYQVSRAKVESLGIQYVPLKNNLKHTVDERP